MKLNPNGVLAKFYMWLPPKDKQLPQDFCTYFWGLIGRAVFIFGMCGTLVLGLVIGLVKCGTWLFYLIVWHKNQTLQVLGGIASFALVMWLTHRKWKKIEVLSEAKAIIEGKVDAVKNRYCPRIQWKNADE